MMKYQSHAVTAQRIEPKDSPDDFPTPPWATRALVEHVIDNKSALASMSCLEPACGTGHMAKVLKEYFGDVRCADAFHYGYAPVRDFLTHPYETNAVDWVITNPHFVLQRSLSPARFRSPALASQSLREQCFWKALADMRRFIRKRRRRNSRNLLSGCP
jgi:hypothetical protein